MKTWAIVGERTLGRPRSTPSARRERLLVPALVASGLLVSLVGSLGSPMVPGAANEYGRTLASAQWILTITLLVGAIATPVLGRLGDGRHRRRVFLGTLAVLLFGLSLCSLPGGFVVFVAGRGLQGVGYGIVPMAMAIARDRVPPQKTSSVIATLSITTAAGAGLGFPLSGFCAQYLGFHETFIVASVFGVAVLGMTAWVIPSSGQVEHRPLDVRGAIQLAVPMALLVYALGQAAVWGLDSPSLWVAIAAAAAGITAWARHEMRSPHPLVDLRALRNREVFIAQLAVLMVGAGMYLLFGLMLGYVQTPASTGYGQGRTVLTAGLIMLPFAIGSFAVGRMLPLLHRTLGDRWVMPAGCASFISAVILFLFSRDRLPALLLLSGLAGLGTGAMFASIPRRIVQAVSARETGSAMGLNQVLRTLGGSVGSAIAGSILAAHTAAGDIFPDDLGYSWSTLAAIGIWVAIAFVVWPRRPRAVRAAAVPDRRSSHLPADPVSVAETG